MTRRRLGPREAKIFWNADSWLPDKYQEPGLVCVSMARWRSKMEICDSYLTAYGDAEKFTDEWINEYEEYDPVSPFKRTKGSDERLHLMLVDLLLHASADIHRQILLIVIAKLSQGSEMICRVLGSLKSKGFPVSFALPDFDNSFGITVCSEETNCRIPVWLCPTLFDNLECPPQPGNSQSYFIEPPAPEPHAIDFTMPADVDTCVFWDVQDYPRPPGLQLSTFCDTIRSAVQANVPLSSGGVKIYAYVVKDEDSPLNSEDDASGINVTVVRDAPADQFARLAKITMDFVLWSMDNPPKLCFRPEHRPNLLLISKPWEDDMSRLYRNLYAMESRGHNVFFALPNEQITSDHVLELPLLSWELLTATASGKRKTREWES